MQRKCLLCWKNYLIIKIIAHFCCVTSQPKQITLSALTNNNEEMALKTLANNNYIMLYYKTHSATEPQVKEHTGNES